MTRFISLLLSLSCLVATACNVVQPVSTATATTMAKRVCPGGLKPHGNTCPKPPPPPTQTCWDGSVILTTQACPIKPPPPPPPTQVCWDGSVILASATCPVQPPPPPITQTCPDGSVILATETCPIIPPPVVVPINYLDTIVAVSACTSENGNGAVLAIGTSYKLIGAYNKPDLPGVTIWHPLDGYGVILLKLTYAPADYGGGKASIWVPKSCIAAQVIGERG